MKVRELFTDASKWRQQSYAVYSQGNTLKEQQSVAESFVNNFNEHCFEEFRNAIEICILNIFEE